MKKIILSVAALVASAGAYAGVKDLPLGVYENEKYCDVQVQVFDKIPSHDLIHITMLDCGAYTLSSNVFMCEKNKNNCAIVLGRTLLANESCDVKIQGPGHLVETCTWGQEKVVADYRLKKPSR